MRKGIKLTGWAKNSAKLVAAITAFQIALGIITLLLHGAGRPGGGASGDGGAAALRRGLACV